MRMFRTSRRATPVFAILGAGLLAISIGGVAFAHADPTEVMPVNASASGEPAPTGGVAEPTGGNGTVSGTPGPAEPTGDGAQHVVPGTPVRDPRPVAIDHINVAGDGTTATIYWYGGTATCYALASVDVKTGPDGMPVITVSEGTLASLPTDQPCIDIGVLYATTVTLDQPLFVDGSQAAPAE